VITRRGLDSISKKREARGRRCSVLCGGGGEGVLTLIMGWDRRNVFVRAQRGRPLKAKAEPPATVVRTETGAALVRTKGGGPGGRCSGRICRKGKIPNGTRHPSRGGEKEISTAAAGERAQGGGDADTNCHWGRRGDIITTCSM